MNSLTRTLIFERLAAAIPEPKTELNYTSTFELLIAVVLSAQATDKGVNKATAKLFPIANTPQAMVDLGLVHLKSYIKTIGLYNTKGKNIIKLCQRLIEQYQGDVPKTREALESLAGVGRKTANVVLNTAFGKPTIAVDTHVFRVANRIPLGKGKTVLDVERQLIKNIPKSYQHDAHHLLILHGRYTCIARNPRCQSCVIEDLCENNHKNI